MIKCSCGAKFHTMTEFILHKDIQRTLRSHILNHVLDTTDRSTAREVNKRKFSYMKGKHKF